MAKIHTRHCMTGSFWIYEITIVVLTYKEMPHIYGSERIWKEMRCQNITDPINCMYLNDRTQFVSNTIFTTAFNLAFIWYHHATHFIAKTVEYQHPYMFGFFQKKPPRKHCNFHNILHQDWSLRGIWDFLTYYRSCQGKIEKNDPCKKFSLRASRRRTKYVSLMDPQDVHK